MTGWPSANRKQGGGGRRSPGKRARPHSPFCVSFVEQTRVPIWKESLLMVQLPRLCRPLPVAEWPFSSSSAFVEGRLRYVATSSSFFASACGSGDLSLHQHPTAFLFSPSLSVIF